MNIKKRFKTVLDLRLEILRVRNKAKSELAKAEITSTRESTEFSDKYKEQRVAELRLAANKLRKHAGFLTEGRIPMLVRVKQKMDTKPMDFMGGDSSEMEEAVK